MLEGKRQMKNLEFSRCSLICCIAAAMLVACSGAQLPIGAHGAIATVLIAALTAATPRASPDQAPSGGGLSVQLETGKAVYHTREPITVRVTIHNTSGTEYGVLVMPPWLLCKLLILDDQDRALAPSIMPTHPGFRGNDIDWDLTPGKSRVSGYYALGDNSTFHEWTPIAFWGYQLTSPGFYTVTAIPHLEVTSRREYVKEPNAAGSTPVRIQVVP
jgi:hypothetical protein